MSSTPMSKCFFSFHRAVRLGPFVKTHTSAVLVLFSHPCSFVFASWHVSLALAIQNPPPLPSLLLEPFDKAQGGLEQPVQGPWAWASAWAWHSHHLQGQTVASACTHTHTPGLQQAIKLKVKVLHWVWFAKEIVTVLLLLHGGCPGLHGGWPELHGGWQGVVLQWKQVKSLRTKSCT